MAIRGFPGFGGTRDSIEQGVDAGVKVPLAIDGGTLTTGAGLAGVTDA
jgi:hypothetical protein